MIHEHCSRFIPCSSSASSVAPYLEQASWGSLQNGADWIYRLPGWRDAFHAKGSCMVNLPLFSYIPWRWTESIVVGYKKNWHRLQIPITFLPRDMAAVKVLSALFLSLLSMAPLLAPVRPSADKESSITQHIERSTRQCQRTWLIVSKKTRLIACELYDCLFVINEIKLQLLMVIYI